MEEQREKKSNESQMAENGGNSKQFLQLCSCIFSELNFYSCTTKNSRMLQNLGKKKKKKWKKQSSRSSTWFHPNAPLLLLETSFVSKKRYKTIWLVLIPDWSVKIAWVRLGSSSWHNIFFSCSFSCFFPLHLLVLCLCNKLPVIILMFIWWVQYHPSVLLYLISQMKPNYKGEKKSTCFSMPLETWDIRLLVGQT